MLTVCSADGTLNPRSMKEMLSITVADQMESNFGII